MTIKLTKNEKTAIQLMIDEGSCKSIEDVLSYLEDNTCAICVTFRDIGKKLGWKKQQVSGLVASMREKGAVEYWEGDPTQGQPDLVYPSEKVLELFFD